MIKRPRNVRPRQFRTSPRLCLALQHLYSLNQLGDSGGRATVNRAGLSLLGAVKVFAGFTIVGFLVQVTLTVLMLREMKKSAGELDALSEE